MVEKDNQPNRKCIVLVPLAQAEIATHVAQKHQLDVTVEHDPVSAMAAVCLLHHQYLAKHAWINSPPALQLLLIHTSEFPHVDQLIAAVRKYFPQAIISELRGGRIENINQQPAVVDSLIDPPIVHAQPIDADELSMLLDDTLETEE